MSEKKDISYDLTITLGQDSYFLIEEFTNLQKQYKGVKSKKIKANKVGIQYKESPFAKKVEESLSTYLCNGLILKKLIKVAEKEQVEQEGIDSFIEAFFDGMNKEITQFQLLVMIDLKRYLKDNKELVIETYWNFNLLGMVKELNALLNNPSTQMILEKIVEDINEDNGDYDEEDILSAAEVTREILLTENPTYKTPTHFDIYSVNKEIHILDTERNMQLNINSLPSDLSELLNFKNLSDANYIMFMLLVFKPKRAIIYNDIDEKTQDKINEFIEDTPVLDVDIDIYFTDDNFPPK